MIRFAAACGLAAACCFAAAVSSAQAAPSLSEKKAELEVVQGRIDALRRELNKAEESHSEAADQLRDTETAISQTQRRMRELANEHNEVSRELGDLDSQIRRLDQSTAGEQRQLARLLNRQFVGGEADALRLILSGQDPNQAARDRYFLTQLSLAKAALTRELRAVASKKRELREQVKAREARISEIEEKQKSEHAKLLREQQQRQTLLAKLASKLKSQRREIGALQRDQQRLGSLIDGLARMARNKAKAAAKLSSHKGLPSVAGETAAKSASAGKPATTPVSKARDADPGKVAGSFGSLRGRLSLPVAGTLAGRFGSPRGDAGGVWKGLFIKANEGADVRAVAPGNVVFSDWLRGFGNLLIVDHEDDFLSIYAFNQSLLKSVGQNVRAGEAVATVGNSGGNADSGLYFELRYQGQAFDPLKWLKK